MGITTIIVDDESLARKGLKLRLQGEPDIDIVAECCNGKEALESIRQHQPDLIFLDVQMPEMNGMDVLKHLPAENLPLIVFVTAYDEYAIKAFEVHAVDYLLKPIDDGRLHQAIWRVKDAMNKQHVEQHKKNLLDFVEDLTGEAKESIEHRIQKGEQLTSPFEKDIFIKQGVETHRIATQDIDSIEAAGDYLVISCKGENFIDRCTMKEMEDRLDPSRFQRIHRSIIVNLERISRVCSHTNGEYILILDNEKELKVSRSYKNKIKELLS